MVSKYAFSGEAVKFPSPKLNKIFILFNYVWRKKPSIPPVFSARFARCDHAILLTFHTVT